MTHCQISRSMDVEFAQIVAFGPNFGSLDSTKCLGISLSDQDAVSSDSRHERSQFESHLAESHTMSSTFTSRLPAALKTDIAESLSSANMT